MPTLAWSNGFSRKLENHAPATALNFYGHEKAREDIRGCEASRATWSTF